MCKACERSIRRGLLGKYKVESKHQKRKAMLLCTRLWQNLGCSCVFADFDTICEAANFNVSVSEDEVYTYLAHYISVQSNIMPPTHTADACVCEW